eukprot:TRINITY_DN4843_c0_g2_i2.p1 TRINITY_DN4843_c0_g2~~TRINITY_DN4843_c0_g2_i2.p1  ORF type:complete len:744 (-),score=133.45 TRINITY_DN4843_c0_g2_i2:407-2638(-)
MMFLSKKVNSQVILWICAYAIAFASAQPPTSTDVILTAGKDPPEGYKFSSALFEGTGYWSTVFQSDYPLSDFTAVEHEGVLYFPGGTNELGSKLATTASFDPLLNVYNNDALPLMPFARSRYGLAKINDTLYIGGGQLQLEEGGDEVPTACMVSLDLNDPGAKWDQEYACMTHNRSDLCIVGVGDELYAVGGYDENYVQLASIERFDRQSNEWEVVAEMDKGRGDLSCVAVDGVIYVLGGVYAGGDWSVSIEEWFLDEFVAFDTVSGSLKQLAPMPHARGDFALVALPNDRLLVMGGETHHRGERTQVAQHFVEEYIISEDIWIEKAPLDLPRFRFGAAYADGVVYVYGGHQTCDTDACSPTALADVEVYVDVEHPPVFMHQKVDESVDGTEQQEVVLSASVELEGYSNEGSVRTGSGYWARIADMPVKLSDFKVVEFDNQLLIIGGLDESSKVLDTVVVYDPLLMTYDTFPARMPEPRSRFAAAIANDKLYVIGGYNTSDYELQDMYGPAAQTLVLDLLSGVWSYGPEVVIPRSDLCAASVNNTVYIAGGWPAGYSETLDSVEALDKSGSWQEVAKLPTPRGDCQATFIQNELIVLGGYYDPTSNWSPDSFRSEVEAYDTTTGEWRALSQLPNARGDKAAVKLEGDRILVMGGETHARGEFTEVGTRFVEEYIYEADAWVEKAPLPEGKFRAGAGYVDGGVYLFGGHGVCPGQEVDCYETAMDSAYVFYDVEGAEIFVHVRD